MKNYTNIYDIDGNLIRAAGDNHKFTLEEVEKLVDDLTEKVKNNPENKVYKVYLNNAQRWLYNMYNNMSKEDVAKRLSILEDTIKSAVEKNTAKEEEEISTINDAIDELKDKYESNVGGNVEPSMAEPEQPVVNPKPIVMDEYVDYEEVK